MAEIYKVLKAHMINEETGRMLLTPRTKTAIPFSKRVVDALLEDGIIELVGDAPNEPVPPPIPGDVPEHEDGDNLPDEYGKDVYPCPNPSCPVGRDMGGEQGPYKREIDLEKHLKKYPDCADFQ